MSVFKDHFLQDQESCIPTKKLDKTPRRPAWMNKGAPGQIQTVKGSLQRVETRTGQRVETRTGIQRGIQKIALADRGQVGKDTTLIELNPARISMTTK